MGKVIVAWVTIFLNISLSYVLASGEECALALKEYKEKFRKSPKDSELNLKEQLEYLNDIDGGICRKNGFYILYKANVLMLRNDHEEALQIIEESVQQKLEPRSLLLEQKASILLRLKESNVGKVTESLDDINAMLKEALELEATSSDPSSLPTIKYTMARVAYVKGDYDKAECLLGDAIQNGKDLSSLFYTFAGVIAAKQKKWHESVKFMEQAIKINNDNYLSEPETIRAMAEDFCQLGRKDLSEKAIALSIAANPQFAEFPDIISAQNEVKSCPNPYLQEQPALSSVK